MGCLIRFEPSEKWNIQSSRIKTGSRSSPSEATEAMFHFCRNPAGMKELSPEREVFLAMIWRRQ